MYKKPRENNFSFNKKLAIFNKAGGKCWYCGVSLVPSTEYHVSKRAFTVDHFDNLAGDDISNLVPACKDCNGRKKGRSVEEFRKSEATRRGYTFSDAQREFWGTLPGNAHYNFFFENARLS